MRAGQVWPQRHISALLDSLVKPSQPERASIPVNESREAPLSETKEQTDTERRPAKLEIGFSEEEDLQAEEALSELAVNAFFEAATPGEQPLAIGFATIGCLLPLCPRCLKPVGEEERLNAPWRTRRRRQLP
jgi:hypothetical protein